MKTVKVLREPTISFSVKILFELLPPPSRVWGGTLSLSTFPGKQSAVTCLPIAGALLPPPGYLGRMVAAFCFCCIFTPGVGGGRM